MPRMRTIEQAATYLRKTDPDTAITKTAIRRLVVSGELPFVRVGQKYLISLEVLEAYLQGTEAGQAPIVANGIRRIDERSAI